MTTDLFAAVGSGASRGIVGSDVIYAIGKTASEALRLAMAEDGASEEAFEVMPCTAAAAAIVETGSQSGLVFRGGIVSTEAEVEAAEDIEFAPIKAAMGFLKAAAIPVDRVGAARRWVYRWLNPNTGTQVGANWIPSEHPGHDFRLSSEDQMREFGRVLLATAGELGSIEQSDAFDEIVRTSRPAPAIDSGSQA